MFILPPHAYLFFYICLVQRRERDLFLFMSFLFLYCTILLDVSNTIIKQFDSSEKSLRMCARKTNAWHLPSGILLCLLYYVVLLFTIRTYTEK